MILIMIVAFYNIMKASYDLSSGTHDLSIDYSNPLDIKDMDFIPVCCTTETDSVCEHFFK